MCSNLMFYCFIVYCFIVLLFIVLLFCYFIDFFFIVYCFIRLSKAHRGSMRKQPWHRHDNSTNYFLLTLARRNARKRCAAPSLGRAQRARLCFRYPKYQNHKGLDLSLAICWHQSFVTLKQ